MLRSRTVWSIAIFLIVTQLAVRGVAASSGSFYWDDLILIGRASTHSLLSWEYLGYSHDGHFMPGAFLAVGLSTVLAPLNWVVPALTLVVLQAIAALSVWRMIRVILGSGAHSDELDGNRGLGALAILAFYLFTPMTFAAYIWWAAGLNTLPMQAALAWIVADAIKLVRGEVAPRRQRMVVLRSALIFLIGLAFFEKSLYILPIAFVAAALALRFTSTRERGVGPLREAARRARELWLSLSVIFGLWTVLYFVTADPLAGSHSVSQTAQLIWRSINAAVVPSLVGGPWEWDRWVPSPPMGFASVWMIVAGWLVVAVVSWWALTSRRGSIPVLAALALYVVGAQIPVMWNRSSGNTALELAQTMRYLPDIAMVIVIALALIVAAPHRAAESSATHRREDHDPQVPPGVLVTTVLVALMAASSTISAATYMTSWRDNPTQAYLANAQRTLAENSDLTMFDQQLPLEVLLPVAYPNNQLSHTFGALDERPEFGSIVTDDLQVLDPSGSMVDGVITPRRTIAAGAGACDNPEVTGPTELQLDGPLLQWPWTIALTYCATREGEVSLSLDNGDPVRVPVLPGLHVVYVALAGEGDSVRIEPLTDGLALHTGEGRVGEVVDARWLDGG